MKNISIDAAAWPIQRFHCLGSLRVVAIAIMCLLGLVPSAQAQCPNVTGTWMIESVDGRPTSDVLPMTLSQNGCQATGSFNSNPPAILHDVVANMNSGGQFTITRRAPGCTALMYGTLTRQGSDGLLMAFTTTNGACNVPSHFPQRRVFRLNGPPPARSVEPAITGNYVNAPPNWDRGMHGTMHCGNNPESWVRGKVDFDRNTGRVKIYMQLETDSTTAGPKGYVQVVLRDANGTQLADLRSEEIGTGGKLPGSAAIRTWSGTNSVSPALAGRVASIHVEANCTGSLFRIYDVTLDTVHDAVNIVKTIATLF